MAPFLPERPVGPHLVKGLPSVGGAPGIRLELRELKKNQDLWNLYLLGLWQFQLLPKDHQLSYFQIAGIHGLPYVAWPEDDPLLAKLKKVDTGFCTHTSILFLTWHRPYLVLFETILSAAVQFVAEQFAPEEGRDRYLAAAKTFRMPFWDWADRSLAVFPDEATNSKDVQVVMPEKLKQSYPNLKTANGQVTIPNPLFAYQLPDGIEEEIIIDGLPTTTRYHARGDPENSQPHDQKKFLIENITPFSREIGELRAEGNLSERVVYLLKSYDIFDQVSHNRWDPHRVPDKTSNNPEINGLGFGSIEDIHNSVHGIVGGNGTRDGQGRVMSGHMGSVPKSAFDPIFWLHHTNIDRIISIWEALHTDPKKPSNPDAWVTTKKAYRPTWLSERGDDEGLNTPLAPFYKDNQNFWTSDDVRSTTMFGYAYPETKAWTFQSIDEYRRDIEGKLQTLYPTASPATMLMARKAGDLTAETKLKKRAQRLVQVKEVSEPSTAVTALALAEAVSTKPTSSSLTAVLPPVQVPDARISDSRSVSDLANSNNTYLEWLVNIKAVKHALGGEYQVHVFLERVPPEEQTVLYSVSPYHVGTFNPLGQSEDTRCGKCQQDQEARTEITGQIPLTVALIERYFAGWLPSLSETHIIEYLQKNLHWEVVNQEGERLQGRRNEVDGLLVAVVSNEVTLPENDGDFARYSPYIKLYPEITTKEDGSGGRAEGTGVTEENKYYA